MIRSVSKSALVIGTETAVASYSSGTSLRLKFLVEFLKGKNYEVTITSKKKARNLLALNFDLILISSFSAAGMGRLARKRTSILWFDPYDSWTQSRFSLIRSGQVHQLILLVRDAFNILRFPSREITTFISEKDAGRHVRFSKQDRLFILPIHFESMAVNQSLKPRLVFVGDGSYGPNQRSLKFLNELGSFTGQEIHIFGKGYRHQNRFPHCKFHGYVDDHSLLWTNDIHLSPIKLGAGLKTKVALPLTYGLRVIASFESSSGFCKNSNLKIAHSKRDFYSLVQEVLGSDWKHKSSYEAIYQRDDMFKLDLFLSA